MVPAQIIARHVGENRRSRKVWMISDILNNQ